MQTVASPPGTIGLATLPSLSTLEQIFASKPDALATTSPSASLAHNTSPGYPIYKSSQLPALTEGNIARRPLPSGRPGSPFSFGDPPAYPRLSPGVFFFCGFVGLSAPSRIFVSNMLISCSRPRRGSGKSKQTLGNLRSISRERESL